jgi:hypothetical protein
MFDMARGRILRIATGAALAAYVGAAAAVFWRLR